MAIFPKAVGLSRESLPDINKYIVCIEINKYRVATKRMRIGIKYILTHTWPCTCRINSVFYLIK